MLGRALITTATAMLTAGGLVGCGAVNEQWDLPMSPLARPSEISVLDKDVCAALDADPITGGCRQMAEDGAAEVIVIPRVDGGLDRYSGDVDGETVRWIGVSRFPAIQLATGSGSDGLASCRVALDVAPGQILLIIYRQRAADPKLAPCRPAREYAAKALRALTSTSP